VTTTPDNTVTILLAIITLIGTLATTIIAAIVTIMTNNNRVAIQKTHDLVNSQTASLLEVTKAASRAQGVAAGAAGELPQDAATAAVNTVAAEIAKTAG
jgi:hypothetical protein